MSTIPQTAARQAASRQNGAKSTGPMTEAGKARSARNATKHGLTGGPVVLPHESQEAYDELKQSLARTYKAATAAEWNLIDEMAASRWRLNRIEIMETAILNGAFERLIEEIGTQDCEDMNADKVMAMAFADVAESSKGFRLLDRHQRTLWRSYDRALQELQTLRDIRAEEPEQPVQLAQIAKRQNEPRLRPGDYSSLRAETSYARGAQFMQSALTHLEKQDTAMEGIAAKRPERAKAA